MLYIVHGPQKSGGVVAMVSGQLIVCGSYSAVMSPSVCVEAVQRMGEWERVDWG